MADPKPGGSKDHGGYNVALSQQFTIWHCASRYEHIFNEIVLAAEHNGDRRRINPY
jgi:hypothetical protein